MYWYQRETHISYSQCYKEQKFRIVRDDVDGGTVLLR